MTFQKGQSGNPHGRPRRDIEQEFFKATQVGITPTDWTRIIRTMVEKAEAGDIQAARFLANYLLGMPNRATAEPELERPTQVVIEYVVPEGRSIPERKEGGLESGDRRDELPAESIVNSELLGFA